ncbi:hypothetical protein Tco_0340898 [Tanacetum coccineum]
MHALIFLLFRRKASQEFKVLDLLERCFHLRWLTGLQFSKAGQYNVPGNIVEVDVPSAVCSGSCYWLEGSVIDILLEIVADLLENCFGHFIDPSLCVNKEFFVKEFLACNPKEYDDKGGAVVLTQWIEKMESVIDMSGCSIDQKVKSLLVHLWFYPSHEMQMLETELWNHVMVRAVHAMYTDRFHELARSIREMVTATEPKTIQKAVQISGALTDEAVRNGSVKKVEKRGNVGEPSKDKNGRMIIRGLGLEMLLLLPQTL